MNLDRSWRVPCVVSTKVARGLGLLSDLSAVFLTDLSFS